MSLPACQPLPEIDVDELGALMGGGGVRLLDVRDEWEFRRGRVPGAASLPLAHLPARVAVLPRDERLLVICEHGVRSRAATDLLLRSGFEGAVSVKGGTDACAHANRPVERDWQVSVDERRLAWDERHRSGDFEGEGANSTLVLGMAGVTGAIRGNALELACGSGANAVWLAGQGWRTTAVDWSPVALARGKTRAAEAGVAVDWLERNLFDWFPPRRAFDLVVIVYLHLPPRERTPIYARAAAAVASGGRLIVVGCDRLNATEGEGGPPDPARLFTADEIGRELLATDPSLVIDRAEVVRRVPPPARAPIDSLLVIRRLPRQ